MNRLAVLAAVAAGFVAAVNTIYELANRRAVGSGGGLSWRQHRQVERFWREGTPR